MISGAGRSLALAALGLVLIAGGCAGAPQPATRPEAPSATADMAGLPMEVGHVHGLGKDPRDGVLLVAGHSGLFRATKDGFQRVGPVADFMGFTVAGPGHYFASGHPQPGTDLPQPMGLIESRDAGATWTVVSRGGESDFHALTVTGEGAIAHDGVLRRSDDLRTWAEVKARFDPLSLAGRQGDPRVVASTATSIMTSSDSGRTWSTVPGSPGPSLVSGAEDVVVAIDADGRIHLSDASGSVWKPSPLRAPNPVALVASGAADGLEIVVLTEQGLVVSRGGRPFAAWTAAS